MKKMVQSNDQSSFSRSLGLTIATLVIFFITFGLYSYAEYRVRLAYVGQLQSILLANQLHQSSDDLTHMIRLYISTSKPIYKKYFQDILSMRDGKAPRPPISEDIYWDLVLTNQKQLTSRGEFVSLLELMRRANFTESEFQKLSQSKSYSDRLTHIEFAAMTLIEHPSPTTDANRLKALGMISDSTYLKAKSSIVSPIADFNKMVKQRTEMAVHYNEQISAMLFGVLIISSLLLVYMLLKSYRALRTTLGCSADELRSTIAKIGRGDFSTQFSVPLNMKNSVLDWLTEMQKLLLHNESERERMEHKIHDMAYYDILTKLPNRRMLSEKLKKALALSKRTSRYGALMFVDLDNFKPANDQFGHGAGDLILIEVGKRLTNCLREVDTIVRFGGDEFVVLLTELEKNILIATQHATLVAEKIRISLAKPYCITMMDGKIRHSMTHHCTASIGVTLFINKEKTPEELIMLADMAMYQAKMDGRNQIHVSERT